MLINILLLVAWIFSASGNGKQQQQRGHNIPEDLFYKMRESAGSTNEFLKRMNIYDREKQRGVLPSQVKIPGLKSRSSDGQLLENMLDLNPQMCEVRPHIHFLEQPPHGENAVIWPYTVKLPRCLGSCNIPTNVLSCVPKKTKQVTLSAYKIYYGLNRKRRDVMEEFSKWKNPVHEIKKRSAQSNTEIRNISINLEIHEECHCKCTTTKEMCTSRNKTFDEFYCRCECPLQVNRTCTPPYQWDEDQCKCVCRPSDETVLKCNENNRRQFWDYKKCACSCYACRPPKVPNEFCKCKCPKIKCNKKNNERLDKRKCKCKKRRN